MKSFKQITEQVLTEGVGLKEYMFFTSGSVSFTASANKFSDWVENENDIMTVESLYMIGNNTIVVLPMDADKGQMTKFESAVEKKFKLARLIPKMLW